MTGIPKCTSVWGHKFEARYSKGHVPSEGLKLNVSGQPLATVIEAIASKTYERDVCIRCGATVEKKP